MEISPTFTTATAVQAALGGVLIGLSATVLLATHGRVAGISGIVGRLWSANPHGVAWRWWFIGGLLAGGVVVGALNPGLLASSGWVSTPKLVVAGLLVGIGTQLGNGCTSGHGVCGLARGSKRSLAATLTFMAVAAAVVFLTRKGGA
jgi:uncharacterized membrane protein YedE/YeeE